MALPVQRQQTVKSVYDSIVDTATAILNHARAARAACNTGMDVDQVVAFHKALRKARTVGEDYADFPGLDAYAKEAMGDPAYDIQAAFTDVVTNGIQISAWLVANLPNDGAGKYAAFSYDGSDFTRIVFTPQQLAPFATRLDALIASITG